jgi:hypothetical protein
MTGNLTGPAQGQPSPIPQQPTCTLPLSPDRWGPQVRFFPNPWKLPLLLSPREPPRSPLPPSLPRALTASPTTAHLFPSFPSPFYPLFPSLKSPQAVAITRRSPQASPSFSADSSAAEHFGALSRDPIFPPFSGASPKMLFQC